MSAPSEHAEHFGASHKAQVSEQLNYSQNAPEKVALHLMTSVPFVSYASSPLGESFVQLCACGPLHSKHCALHFMQLMISARLLYESVGRSQKPFLFGVLTRTAEALICCISPCLLG